METQIFTKENLDVAAKALQQGEIVSFPTETVYGLGAIATSQEAVLKVFKAKGRPSDNPLIVHISDIHQMTSTVEEVPEIALTLAKAFWPGPLTMILKAKPGIYAPALSAGLPTVSFRMPNHPLTLELITKVGIPLVGPSANLSTKPSPTKVQHVFEDMNGRIRGIVDGGSSTVGVESTVIDLTNEEGPVILRPGVITKEQIESGEITLDTVLDKAKYHAQQATEASKETLNHFKSQLEEKVVVEEKENGQEIVIELQEN